MLRVITFSNRVWTPVRPRTRQIVIGLALLTLMTAVSAAPPPPGAVLLNYADVFRTDDYPSEALRKLENGTVGIRVSVSAAGLPTHCEVIGPSQSPSLNAATCNLAMACARFEPPRDRRRVAIAGSDIIRVKWVVPGLDIAQMNETYFKVSFPVTAAGGLGACRFTSPGARQNESVCEAIRANLLRALTPDKFMAGKSGMTLNLYEGQFIGDNALALIGALLDKAAYRSGAVAVLTVDSTGRAITCTAQQYPSGDPATGTPCTTFVKQKYMPVAEEESKAMRTLTRFYIMTMDGNKAVVAPDDGTPPLKNAGLSALFSEDDYPVAALRDGQEGSVSVVLDVTREGQVGACRVDQTSGHATLDQTTCDILRRRARFAPALDQYGKTIADRYRQRVRWALPRTAYKASLQHATIGFRRDGKTASCELAEVDPVEDAPDCDKLTAMARAMWRESGRGSIAGRTVRIEHRTDIDMGIALAGAAGAGELPVWRQIAQYRVRPDGRLFECRIMVNHPARDPLDLCATPIAGPFDVDPEGPSRTARTTILLFLPKR